MPNTPRFNFPLLVAGLLKPSEWLNTYLLPLLDSVLLKKGDPNDYATEEISGLMSPAHVAALGAIANSGLTEITSYYPGLPLADSNLLIYIASRDIELDLINATAFCRATATANKVFQVGVESGSSSIPARGQGFLNFNAGENTGFYSYDTGSTKITVLAGEILRVVSTTSADASLADIYINIPGIFV